MLTSANYARDNIFIFTLHHLFDDLKGTRHAIIPSSVLASPYQTNVSIVLSASAERVTDL